VTDGIEEHAGESTCNLANLTPATKGTDLFPVARAREKNRSVAFVVGMYKRDIRGSLGLHEGILSAQLSFLISGKQIRLRCVLRTASFFCTEDYNLHTTVLRTPFLCAVVANRMVRP
jgi:hypothetical protein